MQIKEYEAFTLKECLQQVRSELGPEAVILETRKFRKGGLMGLGARDAVCIVAATGITVQSDLQEPRRAPEPAAVSSAAKSGANPSPTPGSGQGAKRHTTRPPEEPVLAVAAAKSAPSPTLAQAAAVNAARNAYGRNGANQGQPATAETGRRAATAVREPEPTPQAEEVPIFRRPVEERGVSTVEQQAIREDNHVRLGLLERALQEIREGLFALKKQQQEGQERTISAVVSAVAPAVSAAVGPAVSAAVGLTSVDESALSRFPRLQQRLVESGVSSDLTNDLLDSLPDMSAWSEEAREPLAESALNDLIGRRVACSGPIVLTPGKLKAVALIGPTGVGKTTSIAKLAAHFALVERKKVALLTVDTYRIAAVEQLKTYSQIIDIPILVAYSQAEVMPAVAQFTDYDLLLIDTAGRSQKNIMQVGELKAMLEMLNCETHLVLSAQTKESDMLEAAKRFSAARVDRILFTKLDETGTYGTLLSVADKTGIPLSYLATGQKVPEDLEITAGSKIAELILG